MHILIIAVAIATGARWELVLGQLLASVVLLISGYQDVSLRSRMGAAFWFFMALAFGISALATATWTKLWGGSAICAVALCVETWLILRWWNRKTSP